MVLFYCSQCRGGRNNGRKVESKKHYFSLSLSLASLFFLSLSFLSLTIVHCQINFGFQIMHKGNKGVGFRKKLNAGAEFSQGYLRPRTSSDVVSLCLFRYLNRSYIFTGFFVTRSNRGPRANVSVPYFFSHAKTKCIGSLLP